MCTQKTSWNERDSVGCGLTQEQVPIGLNGQTAQVGAVSAVWLLLVDLTPDTTPGFAPES
jgi:hypothetical protein